MTTRPTPVTANAADAAADTAGAATDAADAWRQRHERRLETVWAPYGPLALTGTLPSA